MSFYLVNFLLFNIYSFLVYISKIKEKKKLLLYMYVLQLGLISGLRNYSVGIDTQLYHNIFLRTVDSSLTNTLSSDKFIGYSFLMKIIGSFSNNSYTIFLLVISMITISLLLLVSYKIEDCSIYLTTFFFMTFYYYYQSLNISRQYLAISLVIASFYFYTKKRIAFSSIIFIVAILIHSTSIIAIIFPILYKMKWSTKKYTLIAIITFFIAVLYPVLSNIFARFFTSYDIYVSPTSDFSSNGGRILLVIFYGLILSMGIIYTSRTKNYSQFFMTIQAVIVISFVLGLVFSSNQLMMRIQIYFEIFLIYYIPLLFGGYESGYNIKKPFFLYLIIPIMWISIIPFFIQLLNNYGRIIPYNVMG